MFLEHLSFLSPYSPLNEGRNNPPPGQVDKEEQDEVASCIEEDVIPLKI